MTIGTGVQATLNFCLRNGILVILIVAIYELSAEMDSDAMVYIPNFIKICSGNEKLLGIQSHRQQSMEAAQIKFTTPLLGYTTLDQQRSINVRE
jgi:hypothetical protein